MKRLPLIGQTRITVPGPARLGHPIGYVIDGKSYQFFPIQMPHPEAVRVYRTRAAA